MSQSDFVSRGQALVAAGQFQEAVKVCRLGLLGRPTTVEGRVVLGQALLALKRYDEVLAEMRVALELDHTSIPAQILKGEAQLRKGDTNGAIETLHKARQAAPGDALILKLLAQAEQASNKPPVSTSHPAVNFVGGGDTKHYPSHSAADGEEDSGGGFTKPTSLSAPGALRRSSQRQAAVSPDGTPSPEQLAIGDKSGTVEVDPELDGVEMPDDVDFDDLAAPPRAARPPRIGGARGSVKASSQRDGSTVQGTRKAQAEALAKKPRAAKKESTPTIDLDEEDDLVDLAETRLPPEAAAPIRGGRARLPGPGTAVRNAVGIPSGPIDAPTGPPRDKPGTAPPPL
ncbi:MAG: tetratricopeptide repeat protein, partial [Acidobacteriota bacterium]